MLLRNASCRIRLLVDASRRFAAQLQEDCALPFGFTLQPFAKHAHVPLTSQPSLHVSNVPRCTDCGAYLNTFNAVDMIGFRCSLCGGYTEWTGNQSRRYGRPQVHAYHRLQLSSIQYTLECAY